jgi:isoleucyl-tRNA synthetase
LALTTDEVWGIMREQGWVSEPSVHLAGWPDGPARELDEQGRQRWTTLLSMRDVVMKALEEQRSKGVIGSPLEARVTLQVGDPALRRWCETNRSALAEAFVVSGVQVETDGQAVAEGPIGVKVDRAPGVKCARCWKHLESVGREAAHPALCERCARVVTTQPRL